MMDSSKSYLALYLAGTTTLPIMACLTTPMVANTVWTVTRFLAARVLE